MDLTRTLRKIDRDSATQTDDPERALREILSRQAESETLREGLRRDLDKAREELAAREIELARALAECRRLKKSGAAAPDDGPLERLHVERDRLAADVSRLSGELSAARQATA